MAIRFLFGFIKILIYMFLFTQMEVVHIIQIEL